MTRYFYTDPLAAAWMSKHFGMRFANQDGLRIENYSDCFRRYENTETAFETVEYFDRGYIHPDSLPLLELVVGDMITCLDWESGTARMITNELRLRLSSGLAAVRIIQRNGLAYHWPESDEGA